jgi:hypothetical protein
MNDTIHVDLTSLLELPRYPLNSADSFILHSIRGFYGKLSPLFPNSPIAFILIGLWLNLLELTVETGYDLNDRVLKYRQEKIFHLIIISKYFQDLASNLKSTRRSFPIEEEGGRTNKLFKSVWCPC